MAQPPFLVDQIKIEPGSAGSRLIKRDPGTGSLVFSDPVVGNILLSQTAGLRNVTNVKVVAKSGSGAQYTSIQSALDDIPVNSSASNPYLVLVMPGRYDETINIVRDGVRLVGLGQPEIRSALESTPDAGGADHTLIVSAQMGSIPLDVLVEGFVITNVHANKAAVRVVGGVGSTLGLQAITLRNCSLQANSDAGNYTLWATTCNNVIVEGGRWFEAHDLGLVLVQEVSYLVLSNVQGLGALNLRYDAGEVAPDAGPGKYLLTNCLGIAENTQRATPIDFDCDGEGQIEINGCSLNHIVLSGTQDLVVQNSVLQDLVVSETARVFLPGSVRGTLTANANAFLNDPKRSGQAVFGASQTQSVVFEIPFTNASYQVSFEVNSRPVNDETPWVTAKTSAGFTLNFQTAQTLTLTWMVTRFDV